jgi:hypothetical protein
VDFKPEPSWHSICFYEEWLAVKSGFTPMMIEQILLYVWEHPDAEDAAEGIHKFWLVSSPPVASEEVQRSLNFLVERGWLIVSDRPATPKLYRLNKLFLVEIQLFLKTLGNRESVWHDLPRLVLP